MVGKAYLGDGVYVEVVPGMLKLTTEGHNPQAIYLEPEVYFNLTMYYERAVKEAERDASSSKTEAGEPDQSTPADQP